MDINNTNQPKRGRGRPPKPKQPAPKTATEIIKKPQNTYAPTTIELPEGDNNKYTTFALAIMQMPKIDVNDPVQLGERLVDYFQICADNDMKPGVAALALALGLDRRRLWEINNDVAGRNVSMPQECKDIIKSAYNSLEALWESYMINGKINPVAAIFIGKNNFQYRDQQEYVVTPNTMNQNTPVDVIEAKYEELPDE